jgi:DNA-binding MarR family transcriptional regulator
LKEVQMPTAIDADTAQRLRIVFGRLARLLRATDAAGPAADLTPTRVVVLLNTVRNGPIRLAELAEQEGLNPTMLSRTVADLVEAGLVVRTADAGDRRSAWLAPTDAGRGLAEEIRRHRTRALGDALSGLDQGDQRGVERALPALEHLAEQLIRDRS